MSWLEYVYTLIKEKEMAANKQGWDDFDDIINHISGIKDVIRNIHSQLETLKRLKEDIMDDTTRKAELKKIIDQHPDFTIQSLGADFTKLIALHTWLEENGYL